MRNFVKSLQKKLFFSLSYKCFQQVPFSNKTWSKHKEDILLFASNRHRTHVSCCSSVCTESVSPWSKKKHKKIFLARVHCPLGCAGQTDLEKTALGAGWKHTRQRRLSRDEIYIPQHTHRWELEIGERGFLSFALL